MAFPRNEAAYLQLALKLNEDGSVPAAPEMEPVSDGAPVIP